MGKKSKSKTKSEPWKPLQPYILGAAGTLNNIVNSNQGTLNELSGDIRGHLPGLADMAFGSNPALSSGLDYAHDVLGGKYLGQGNPWMGRILDQTRQNVGNQVNSTFSMAGRTGGGNHAGRLSEGLANAENALRYQDYSSERDRMAQQGSMLPGLIQSQYAGVTPYLAAVDTAGRLPYAGAAALSPMLGMAAGSGTTTQSQSNGLLNSLIGAGATLGSALISKSDANAKENIELVWRLENGLGLYEWDYKQDVGIEGRFRGVMAQEVEKIMPWMLGPRVDGYMTVRYTPERVG